MFLVFASILLCFQSFQCNGNVIANPRTTWGYPDNSNVKSVNDIKEDLRRNNDDYRDKTLKGDKLFGDSLDNNDVDPIPNRRNFQIVRDGEIFNDSVIITKSKRITKGKSVTAQAKLASGPTHEDKAEKRLRFMNKYKEMMNDFMDGKKAGSHTMSMPTLAEEGDRDMGRAGEGYQRALDDEGSDHDRPKAGTPSPYELDMAPARGGRVHSLRMKNRLCHRNVMIPEGPKYDSHGAVYLREHNGKGRLPNYQRTGAPRILLPRCCNCCKKSVLGCE